MPGAGSGIPFAQFRLNCTSGGDPSDHMENSIKTGLKAADPTDIGLVGDQHGLNRLRQLGFGDKHEQAIALKTAALDGRLASLHAPAVMGAP